jgi:tRNA A-37 threonylcarbamoyl transferase component Bud32
MAVTKVRGRVPSFGFRPGKTLGGKYEVMELLGKGFEGEVYRVRELATGLQRTAKFFYPQRNPRDRAVRFYATKLDRLRSCKILIPYLTHDSIRHRKGTVKFLVSEFVEGEPLREFVQRQRGGRLSVFEGLHLLHAIVTGLEQVHALRDYHGDLHPGNIIVSRHGIGFQVKLIDVYRWEGTTRQNIFDDVCNAVRIFYEAVGGKAHYARQPAIVKEVCCGLRRVEIARRFRTAGELRVFLENLSWDE